MTGESCVRSQCKRLWVREYKGLAPGFLSICGSSSLPYLSLAGRHGVIGRLGQHWRGSECCLCGTTLMKLLEEVFKHLNR